MKFLNSLQLTSTKINLYFPAAVVRHLLPFSAEVKKQRQHLEQQLQDFNLFFWLVKTSTESLGHSSLIGGQSVGQSGLWQGSGYETKPNSGWTNRPTVPRTHTVTNTHRKILSITMATYFQSSSTCKHAGNRSRKRVSGAAEERVAQLRKCAGQKTEVQWGKDERKSRKLIHNLHLRKRLWSHAKPRVRRSGRQS